MTTELPKWVWDMIIQLEEQEDIHPKFYVQVDAKYPEQGYTYQPSPWCAGTVLNSVPTDIRGQARAIRDYKRQADLDKEPGDGAGR